MGRAQLVRLPVSSHRNVSVYDHYSIEMHSIEIAQVPIRRTVVRTKSMATADHTMVTPPTVSVTICHDSIMKNVMRVQQIVTEAMATLIRLVFDVSFTIEHRPMVDSKSERIIDMWDSMRHHTIRNKPKLTSH